MASGPGKAYREGLTLSQLLKMFPDDDAAREWFEAQLWPDVPTCPYCGSSNVQSGIKHPTMGKNDPKEKPVVRLKPSPYKPSKVEIEEDVSIDTAPEQLARALGRQVRIQREDA